MSREATVPLSEEEQRLLEQLEVALAADDPNLASALRGSKLRARNRRRAMVSVVGFVVGIAALMVGVIVVITPLGVVGFVIMLGSAYAFLIAWRSGVGSRAEAAASREREPSSSGGRGVSRIQPATSGSFMDRMEERWRRRRDSGPGN